MNFARFVPAALLTPLMGLAGDRFSRRDVMLAVAAGRALLCLLVALAAWTGASILVVAALSAAASVLSTGYRPAQTGLLPLLSASPRQMAAANAVWSGADSLGVLVGSVAGGALMAAAGPGRRAGGAGRLPRDPERPPAAHADGHPDDGRAGGGALDTLIIAAAMGVLGIGEAGTGQLYAAWGMGGIAGGVVSLALLGRGRLASGLTLGCRCMGLPLVALGVWTTVPVAFAALARYGIGFGLQETATMTLLQRLAADDVLARVFGVTETVYLLAVGLGAPLAALAVETAGIGTAFVLAGAALPLYALLHWSALTRYEDAHPVPERPFDLLRQLPMFTPLPVATVETLALRMQPVDVDAGRAVIVQGDPADTFYVVSDGALEVRGDGRKVRVLGEGDAFGEIALVRRGPRSATVRALTGTALYSLDADAFVSAVTGHARSRDAVTWLIDERLQHAVPAGD